MAMLHMRFAQASVRKYVLSVFLLVVLTFYGNAHMAGAAVELVAPGPSHVAEIQPGSTDLGDPCNQSDESGRACSHFTCTACPFAAVLSETTALKWSIGAFFPSLMLSLPGFETKLHFRPPRFSARA